jgi:two-component system, NarL family, nitrate/nitrite response regulator NarL
MTSANGPSPAAPIRVGIVGAVRVHRDGVAALLRACAPVRIVGSFAPREALSALRDAPVDVILIDAPPWQDEPGVAARLRAERAELPMLAIGFDDSNGARLACAVAGIDASVGGDATVVEILAAIEQSMRRRRPSARAASIGPQPPLPLTPRELQVAQLINRGLSNKEIARRLGVRPCTAKNHVRHILVRLDVHRRGQAAAKLRALLGERFSAAPPSDP